MIIRLLEREDFGWQRLGSKMGKLIIASEIHLMECKFAHVFVYEALLTWWYAQDESGPPLTLLECVCWWAATALLKCNGSKMLLFQLVLQNERRSVHYLHFFLIFCVCNFSKILCNSTNAEPSHCFNKLLNGSFKLWAKQGFDEFCFWWKLDRTVQTAAGMVNTFVSRAQEIARTGTSAVVDC